MNQRPVEPLRWWPATVILSGAAVALMALWIPDMPNRQTVVFGSLGTLAISVLLLLIWFFAFSRLPGRQRTSMAIGLLLVGITLVATVRIRGVSGDFVPILSWRWSGETGGGVVERARDARRGAIADYPQFLGPSRNASLPDLVLSDWSSRPPREVWRRPVGPGWSSFAIVGTHAITQEQRGDQECVVSYDLLTGKERWVSMDTARFESTVAGVGPRATPTIHGGRVFFVWRSRTS